MGGSASIPIGPRMYNKVRPPPAELCSDSLDDNEQLVPKAASTRTWRRYLQSVFSIGQMGGKPPSNPQGWPYSTEEDIAERPARIVRIGSEQQFTFYSNFVKTSKYELWNFLGKFLIEEFDPVTKIANCYFLGIAGLQVCITIIDTMYIHIQ
jgi:hypothetical protein